MGLVVLSHQADFHSDYLEIQAPREGRLLAATHNPSSTRFLPAVIHVPGLDYGTWMTEKQHGDDAVSSADNHSPKDEYRCRGKNLGRRAARCPTVDTECPGYAGDFLARVDRPVGHR